MVINHPRIMRRNVGIIKKRLNPDSTILLQDHSYRYYRNEHTYYDTDRHLYFYLEGDGWRIAASLPSHIKLSNDYISVELDTDKPYEYYEEHSGKYPPGQMKKGEKKKGKKWANK